MKTSLTKGMEVKEKKDFEIDFANAYIFRTMVIKRLKGKIEEARKESRAKTSYDNPNWPYLQADLMGYERALEQVISILDGK